MCTFFVWVHDAILSSKEVAPIDIPTVPGNWVFIFPPAQRGNSDVPFKKVTWILLRKSLFNNSP